MVLCTCGDLSNARYLSVMEEFQRHQDHLNPSIWIIFVQIITNIHLSTVNFKRTQAASKICNVLAIEELHSRQLNESNPKISRRSHAS